MADKSNLALDHGEKLSPDNKFAQNSNPNATLYKEKGVDTELFIKQSGEAKSTNTLNKPMNRSFNNNSSSEKLGSFDQSTPSSDGDFQEQGQVDNPNIMQVSTYKVENNEQHEVQEQQTGLMNHAFHDRK